ncbi:ScbA/BarX family gamma-butyrolactone biosynthesis protein [Agreia sp. COWG]|uniref:ScbA/BarX family gamma-butyrolactone biosynthesis protein n=1 Tax=Agreia sp. COWG TaxID=2773266 RepID=UPI0019262CEC
MFLTEAEAIAPDTFYLSGQWPRRHFYYQVDNGRVDAVLIAETLRQATILVAHSFYDIPMDQRFLMKGIQLSLVERWCAALVASAEIDMIVNVDNVRSNTSGVYRLRTNVEFFAGGDLIARGVGDLQLLAPRVYDRMRGSRAHRSIAPCEVATSDISNLMGNRGASISSRTTLSTGPWDVLIDARHPVFFDHPVDHLPGMLALEVMRQVAQAVTGREDHDIVDFDGEFARFVELDLSFSVEKIEATAAEHGQAPLQLRVCQEGQTAILATLTLK